MGDGAMAFVPQPAEPEVVGGRAVELGTLDHLQHRFLDAGGILVLGGWLVFTYSFGNPAANTERVLTGFVLLLLGVFLILLSPVANQFLGAARAGAALANAVVNYFTPANWL